MPSRRALLQAVAASAPALRSRSSADESGPPAVSLPVHVHRVPSIDDETYRRVTQAVDVGVEQVARHADATLDRDVEYSVSIGETAPRRTVSTATRTAVFDSATDWLDDIDRLDSNVVHLVLVDSPFDQAIGYGGNRTHLATGAPISYVNVGATEQWDGPAVSANLAIHEVLHELVTPREVRSVLDRGCEHDLGAILPLGGNGAIVTPFASAYAELTYASETQWPGSGCTGGFSEDVGYDPRWWGHTYALSSATKTATARYVDRL